MTTNADTKVDLDSALSSIFTQAEKTMGLRFLAEPDSQKPHEKTYKVNDADTGKMIGIIVLDPHTRRSTSRAHNSAEDRTLSVVSVNMNLPKPKEGENVLLDTHELGTFFQLSSHALSALAKRKSLSGVKVQHDFVEIPSSALDRHAPKPSV